MACLTLNSFVSEDIALRELSKASRLAIGRRVTANAFWVVGLTFSNQAFPGSGVLAKCPSGKLLGVTSGTCCGCGIARLGGFWFLLCDLSCFLSDLGFE